MASTKKAASNANYYQFFGSQMGIRKTEETEDTKKFTNKNGKTQIFEPFESISGHLKALEIKEQIHEGLKYVKLVIVLNDGHQSEILELSMNGALANNFLSVTPNLDLAQEIEIYRGFDKAKQKPFIYVKQNGETVKHYYTRDNKNGLPELKKVKIKGKEEWDNSEQLVFWDYQVSKITEQLKSVKYSTIESATFEDEQITLED